MESSDATLVFYPLQPLGTQADCSLLYWWGVQTFTATIQARFLVRYLVTYAGLPILFIRKLLFNAAVTGKPIIRPVMWAIIRFVNMLFINYENGSHYRLLILENDWMLTTFYTDSPML